MQREILFLYLYLSGSAALREEILTETAVDEDYFFVAGQDNIGFSGIVRKR
jgi:hypothetical protein